MYKAIVRPYLEYCKHAWSPYLRKNIDMLEKIQRRATKLITGQRDLSYEERLKECGLTTLETRRLKGDQIEVINILNGYEHIDSNILVLPRYNSPISRRDKKLNVIIPIEFLAHASHFNQHPWRVSHASTVVIVIVVAWGRYLCYVPSGS